MLKLTNKVALVTGAAKGIGAAVARNLGAAGATVIVNYASSKQEAEKLVSEINQAGGEAVAIQANVSLINEVKRLFDDVKTAYGRLDVLVNNAGVYHYQPIEQVDTADFYHHFNTNVLGTVLTTQEALKLFPESGGSIINMGSVIINSPMPTASIYAASKGAVALFSRTLAKELGPKNIRVNLVNPGATETEGIHHTGIVMGQAFEQQIIGSTPLGRLGQPQDIATTVTFLASDEAAWITGAQIDVSGGY